MSLTFIDKVTLTTSLMDDNHVPLLISLSSEVCHNPSEQRESNSSKLFFIKKKGRNIKYLIIMKIIFLI